MAELPEPEIEEDLVDGAQFDEGPDGRTLVRQVLIKNLAREPASTLLVRARALLPAWGEPHPELGDPDPQPEVRKPNYCVHRLQVRNRLNSRDSARGRIEYLDFSSVAIRFNGNVAREGLRWDVDLQPLTVRYQPGMTSARPRAHPSAAEGVFSWTEEQPVYLPRAVLEFERYDFGTRFDDAPTVYPGMLNKEAWQGEQPRSWLCVDVETTLLDAFWRGGAPTPIEAGTSRLKIARRAYRFQFIGARQITWDSVIWYKDRITRIVPSDVDPKLDGFPDTAEGNGWRRVRMQGERDFGAELALPDIYS